MPVLKEALPKYRKHKASGQAIVTIQGHDFYLGPWNSKASRIEYDRIIAEYLAAGRQLPIKGSQASDLTVVEVLAALQKYAKAYYRKNGEPTGSGRTSSTRSGRYWLCTVARQYGISGP